MLFRLSTISSLKITRAIDCVLTNKPMPAAAAEAFDTVLPREN